MRYIDARRAMPALVAGLLIMAGLGWAAPARAADFGGRAYGAYLNVLGSAPGYIADTGALSTATGWSGATLPGASVPGVLSAETLVAATSGGVDDVVGDVANSSTSLANVVLLAGSPAGITAALVRSQVDVTDAGASGYSQIDGLTFAGAPVAVTGLPNQTVALPGVATLVINEQVPTASGLVVNALHLILATGGEVILSGATSSISE